MATELTSDSNLGFRLIPLDESDGIAGDDLPPVDELARWLAGVVLRGLEAN